MEQFSLLSGAMRLPKGMDGESAAKAYMIALEGLSSWSIRESIVRIIKGNAKGFNLTFMPAAPELAVYCKSLEKSEYQKIRAIERVLTAPEEKEPEAIISKDKHEIILNGLKQYSGTAA